MRRSVALGLLLLLALGTAAAAVAWDDRVAPGVRVAGADLGGLTASRARAAIDAVTEGAAVTLVGPGMSIELDVASGIDVDRDRVLADALAVGRSGSVGDRARDVIGALLDGREIPLGRRITDVERFERVVELVASTIERPAVDGDVWIESGIARVREPLPGASLDRSSLVEGVLTSGGRVARVDVPVRPIDPAIDAYAVTTAYEQLRTALLPLVLVTGSEQVVIEPARLAALLRVARDTSVEGDAFAVSVDPAAIDALLREAAASLEGAARDAILVPGGERLAVVPGRDGVAIDRDAAWTAILRAVLGAERTVTLPATVTHPALTTSAAQRTADTHVLLGSAVTYFPESWARATNIGAAARTFDGMTVLPGEQFSFWQRIGEVSPATGYVYAGTIIGGVSSEAIGGGLCQVSTTFFNAVASAGYAIDERHPHSYYIERYPLGLDAAVFAPSTDMRWTNDTQSTALIRASATDTSVTFWLYGAPSGRTTTFSEPSEWNVRWPSANQPADPGHVPGYVVAGRDTSVTRTVIAGGIVIHQDTWYSHYDPVWGGPAR